MTTHTEHAARCPKGSAHTDCPPGYSPWFAWAEEKAKTHYQVRCEGCQRFEIWVPIEDGETAFSVKIRPDRTFLRIVREVYQWDVCKHVGDGAIDKAISVPGAFYILTVIAEMIALRPREYKVGEVSKDAVRILDMGLGYLSVCVQQWATVIEVEELLVYHGRDHDPGWVAFVESLLRNPDSTDELLGFPNVNNTHLGVIDRTEEGQYDVIVVDHGPTLDTRASDVPWLVSMLAPGGVMLFDDWRPKHEGRIRRALAAVGGSWDIGMGDDTKRTARDKGIGYARRR